MGTLKVWDGAAWQTASQAGPAGAAGSGAELFYGEITANKTITASTDPTAQEVISSTAAVYDGSPIWIEFFSAWVVTGTNSHLCVALWDATTNMGYMGQFHAGGIADLTATACYLKRRIMPSASSHTFRVCAWGPGSPTIYAGGGAANSMPPAYLRISRA
jgi:hypothetical protein